MIVDKLLPVQSLSGMKIHFITNYKNLEAWKKNMLLVKEVYTATATYPKNELYALTLQTRQAAVSIPASIGEGVGRKYKKNTIQFLHISRGSLYELETLLDIAVMVEILSEEIFKSLAQMPEDCIKILTGLISYFEESNLK